MEDLSYKRFGSEGGNGKCSRSIVLILLLLFILIGLGVVIGVTFVLKLQCDDDDEKHTPVRNSTTSNNSVSFLLFSDIHLDPMYKSTAPQTTKTSFCRNESMRSTYDAPFGRIGCDSPLKLLDEVLSAMKKQAASLPKLDFVMLSGDTCAHRLSSNIAERKKQVFFIAKTTSKAVHLAFPSIPYFPSIGNNDLPGHYIMPGEDDTFYSDLLEIWQDAILCKDCKMKYQTTTLKELSKTFQYGGFYRVSIAGGNMTLLVLNSMYWTRSTWRPYEYFTKRANVQLAWLKNQLQLAKSSNKRVIITSHIPPGIDAFNGLSLWLSNFTDQYMDIVANKYSDVVAGQIYAHFHKDSFRFLQPNKKDPKSSYVLLMPSVSVVYRNNPNFRVVYLDPDHRAVTDYEQYYMNLVLATEFKKPTWQLDYRFSSRYPPSGDDDQVINGKRIKNLSDNLINQSDDSFFNGYISSRQVRYQPDPYSIFKYYCAVTYYAKNDFDACMKKYIVPGG